MDIEEKPIEATLTFFLPEHQEEFKRAVNSYIYVNALEDISSICRSFFKYGSGVDYENIVEIESFLEKEDKEMKESFEQFRDEIDKLLERIQRECSDALYATYT